MFANLRTDRAKRGFYLVGLLIVLAIIMILTYNQWGGKNGEPGLAKISIDRSKDVACQSNRLMVSQGLAMWRINHSGEVPTIEKLRQAGSVPGCPTGGIYSLSKDGSEVYCSLHYPDPTFVPTPAPTPTPEVEDKKVLE